MAQTISKKKLDVINLYIGGLPDEQIQSGANASSDEVTAIVTEFNVAAKRLFELEQQTGKTCSEIISELKEMIKQKEALIGDLCDMECM